MSGLEKFKKDLPWKEKLYSSLTSKNIIDKGYNYVLNVWNKSEMKTMKNYHDLYLKCDVLSLTDAFEKFMNNSLKNYVLCSSHYLSASGLTLDTMLKMTKSKLELIPDISMYIFSGKGTRDEISYISNGYSKVINKHFKFYDLKQESEHNTYLDANNLYGYATSKFLPTSGFRWIDRNGFDSNKYTNNILKRCLLEVDLEYPKNLQEL